MMLGKPTFAALSVAALLPVQVLAQDIAGATTLGFGLGSVSDGGGDFNVLSLDSQMRFDFNNGLSLGAGLSLARLDADGAGSDPRLSAFNLDLRYGMANGVNIGGYVDHGKLEDDIFFDDSMTSFGLMIGRSTDLMDVEFFVGTTDIKDVSGVDWTDVGLSASTSLGDAGVIGGHLVNSHLSGGGESGDMTSVGLGAAYGFGNGLTGFGGLTYADLDGEGDVTTVGIGLGYDLSGWTNMPMVASLELSRSRLSASGAGSMDADSVRFGLTLPLGGSSTVAPQNSTAAAAMAPRRNAVSTTLLGMY